MPPFKTARPDLISKLAAWRTGFDERLLPHALAPRPELQTDDSHAERDSGGLSDAVLGWRGKLRVSEDAADGVVSDWATMP